MDDEEEVTEVQQWVYLGVRVGADNKRKHGWRIPSKEGEGIYDHKGSYWVIGGIYDVDAVPGSTEAYVSSARYTGEKSDEVDRQVLWAKHHAARAQLENLARERSDAKVDELDKALESILRVAHKLRNGPERDAFVMYVTRRLHAAWFGVE